MKLPIPNMNSDNSAPEGARKLLMETENMGKFKEAVNQIDSLEFGKEVLMKYKENPLLTKYDFKDFSKTWIIVVHKNGGAKFLFFMNSNKSQLELYYCGFDYNENQVGTDYQHLEFNWWNSGSYFETIDSLLSWAEVYSINSIGFLQFMNWKGSPFEVK